uniref:Uncharacterized protein n=1 Tax=Solanum lycopersicum TaxID=4081 RepID=A0A3Q7FQ51_SOLLC
MNHQWPRYILPPKFFLGIQVQISHPGDQISHMNLNSHGRFRKHLDNNLNTKIICYCPHSFRIISQVVQSSSRSNLCF